MMREGDNLSPTMTLQEAVRHSLIQRLADAFAVGLVNLLCGRDMAFHGFFLDRAQQCPFLVHGQMRGTTCTPALFTDECCFSAAYICRPDALYRGFAIADETACFLGSVVFRDTVKNTLDAFGISCSLRFCTE